MPYRGRILSPKASARERSDARERGQGISPARDPLDGQTDVMTTCCWAPTTDKAWRSSNAANLQENIFPPPEHETRAVRGKLGEVRIPPRPLCTGTQNGDAFKFGGSPSDTFIHQRGNRG